MKRIFFLMLCLLITGIAMSQSKRMPDIQLPDANGHTVHLSSLKGKVVLVDFWASWCGPCRRSMPALKTLYSQYKNKGFEVYGISLDDNIANWKRAVKEDETQWVHVIDTEGRTAAQFNIRYIPTSFLIDKDGKLVATNAEPEALEKWLNKLL